MSRIGRFFKAAGKWTVIIGGGYLIFAYLGELPFETRTTWFFVGLAMAIAYVEGSLRDRIEALEYRVDEHSRRLNGCD